MCGICGIAIPDHSPRRLDGAAVTRMRDAISHRGPDDAGLFMNRRVALGHRRLSIIDLSESANQPMTNEAGTVSIVESDTWSENAVQQRDVPHGDIRPEAQVRADTLDAVCAAEGIAEITFLKMNIEGAERQALPGMDNTIGRVRQRDGVACTVRKARILPDGIQVSPRRHGNLRHQRGIADLQRRLHGAGWNIKGLRQCGGRTEHQHQHGCRFRQPFINPPESGLFLHRAIVPGVAGHATPFLVNA